MKIPKFEDIQKTHNRIKNYIHQTPVLSSESINKITGSSLFFKCKSGAF